MDKGKQETKYDKVLQKFNCHLDVLLFKFLPELHTAYHENSGLDITHEDVVNRIKNDCITICLNKLEITETQWCVEYGIDQLKQVRRVKPVTMESRHTQICECCGEEVYDY